MFSIYPQLFKIVTVSLLSFTFPFISILPTQSAEEIDFVYDSVEKSLKVNSLEKFVNDNIVDENLGFYFNLLDVSETDKQLFREVLTKKIEIDPVVLSRLLNTDEGERLLDFFGKVINIQRGGNGKFALRGAIVTSALSPEGLTLLNFLRNLSVDVQIDIRKAIAFAEEVNIIVKGTEEFVDEVAELSAQEAQKSPSIDYSQLPDLTKRGKLTFTEKKWILNRHLQKFIVFF